MASVFPFSFHYCNELSPTLRVEGSHLTIQVAELPQRAERPGHQDGVELTVHKPMNCSGEPPSLLA